MIVFLFRHLQQVRPKVHRIPDYHEDWPEYLLRMARKDVVIGFGQVAYSFNQNSKAAFSVGADCFSARTLAYLLKGTTGGKVGGSLRHFAPYKALNSSSSTL